MKIYVASSWRNPRQQDTVRYLRDAGYGVYDFREPGACFHWSDIDPGWEQWTPEEFQAALDHPLARMGFQQDYDALVNCDACVLDLPCGRSAHLELGLAVGLRKFTLVLLAPGEPELMYKMADRICLNLLELLATLRVHFVQFQLEK